MSNLRITSIEWTTLTGERPREARCNARLGVHGIHVQLPIARITLEDGSSGFGYVRQDADIRQAERLLGERIDTLLHFEVGAAPTVAETARSFEYPLWDILGRRAGLPVYKLIAQMKDTTVTEPISVPCYDTSLYIDDLHLARDAEAADLIATEARDGFERHHRAFKIKVGRGARHMPIEEGTRRDIAVIRAVQDAVGIDCPIMLDANNGFNLNLTKHLLTETADCNIFWMEEPFHEDPILYGDLKEWLAQEKLEVLLSDGEGLAAPPLVQWAKDGLIDVVQYDIFSYGFTRWIEVGAVLDKWSVRSAPHHYGRFYGNYVSGHLAGAIRNFTYVEWDEATMPAIDTSAYRIENGHVLIPDVPGFGLRLDDAYFERQVRANGFQVSQR